LLFKDFSPSPCLAPLFLSYRGWKSSFPVYPSGKKLSYFPLPFLMGRGSCTFPHRGVERRLPLPKVDYFLSGRDGTCFSDQARVFSPSSPWFYVQSRFPPPPPPFTAPFPIGVPAFFPPFFSLAVKTPPSLFLPLRGTDDFFFPPFRPCRLFFLFIGGLKTFFPFLFFTCTDFFFFFCFPEGCWFSYPFPFRGFSPIIGPPPLFFCFRDGGRLSFRPYRCE